MARIVYKDEDGLQECKFDTTEQMNEFIRHNEERVKQFHDEKFEVISTSED